MGKTDNSKRWCGLAMKLKFGNAVLRRRSIRWFTLCLLSVESHYTGLKSRPPSLGCEEEIKMKHGSSSAMSFEAPPTPNEGDEQ